MPTYTATFRTDSAYALESLEAETPEAALAKAQALLEQDYAALAFEPYDDWGPVDEIEIADDATFELALWRSPDLRLRLAASELVAAVKLALLALNAAPNFRFRHERYRTSYEVCAALEAVLRDLEPAPG
jgi:hypothetical protein